MAAQIEIGHETQIPAAFMTPQLKLIEIAEPEALIGEPIDLPATAIPDTSEEYLAARQNRAQIANTIESLREAKAGNRPNRRPHILKTSDGRTLTPLFYKSASGSPGTKDYKVDFENPEDEKLFSLEVRTIKAIQLALPWRGKQLELFQS